MKKHHPTLNPSKPPSNILPSEGIIDYARSPATVRTSSELTSRSYYHRKRRRYATITRIQLHGDRIRAEMPCLYVFASQGTIHVTPATAGRELYRFEGFPNARPLQIVRSQRSVHLFRMIDVHRPAFTITLPCRAPKLLGFMCVPCEWLRTRLFGVIRAFFFLAGGGTSSLPLSLPGRCEMRLG